MRIKQTIAILAGAVLAFNTFAQGILTFANGSGSRVVDPQGNFVGRDAVVAGLYYTTDSGLLPGPTPGDPLVAEDGFILEPSSVVAVTTSDLSLLQGRFSAPNVGIEGQAPGAQIYVQARVWSVGYNSYAEAVNSGDPTALVGVSNLGGNAVTLVELGGTTPASSTASLFTAPIALVLVPEPSTVILGLLGGLGALVLLRKRN